MEFTVEADGTITGSVTAAAIGTGTINGTVDDMGDVDATANVIVDNCDMIGSIDDAGNASGTFTCPAVMCTGTWEATVL